MSQKPWFTDERRQKFLEKLAMYGTITKAAEAVDIGPATVMLHRKKDPDFQDAVELAMEEYRSRIEDEVHRRAIEGWDEPVFYKGEEVGLVRRFSDRLLELHAKRHIPEYRDKVEISGRVDMGVLVVGARMSSIEEWAETHDPDPAKLPETKKGLSAPEESTMEDE